MPTMTEAFEAYPDARVEITLAAKSSLPWYHQLRPWVASWFSDLESDEWLYADGDTPEEALAALTETVREHLVLPRRVETREATGGRL